MLVLKETLYLCSPYHGDVRSTILIFRYLSKCYNIYHHYTLHWDYYQYTTKPLNGENVWNRKTYTSTVTCHTDLSYYTLDIKKYRIVDV